MEDIGRDFGGGVFARLALATAGRVVKVVDEGGAAEVGGLVCG